MELSTLLTNANTERQAMANDGEGTSTGLSSAAPGSHFKAYKAQVEVGAVGEPTGGISETARNLLSSSAMDVTVGAGQEPAKLMPRVAVMMARTGITLFRIFWPASICASFYYRSL